MPQQSEGNAMVVDIEGLSPLLPVTVDSTAPSTSEMAQDAEVGPEFLDIELDVSANDRGITLHRHQLLPTNTRHPMNQEEFDQRFHYTRTHRDRSLSYWLRRSLRPCHQPFTSTTMFMASVVGFIPILSWLPAYKWKECLLADALGGLTVGVMHVPQGIAYALLARVDPVVGLYTSFFPPLFYMIFGTSRHNSIGSFAVVAFMAGMAVEQVQSTYSSSPPDKQPSPLFISSTLCFCVGLVHLAMGLLRLEIITTYLSDQLVAGFTTAATVHVFIAQLKDLFGLKALPSRSGAGQLFRRLFDILTRLPETNLATIGLSLGSLIFLLVGKEWFNPWVRKRFNLAIPLPIELALVCLSTAFAQLFHLHSRYGVTIVMEIPTGIPQPILPDLSLLSQLMPPAIGIAVVVVAVHISLAKMFAKKLGYRIDPGQELYALGLASTMSAFFPVYPVSCSLGRTIVNVEAGTKTQLSILFSSAFLCAIILYLGQWLRTLPMCVLSVIIIVALKGMFKKFKDLLTLWPLSKIDFSIWLVAFVVTVAWDVIQGLAVAILYALLTTVFRTQFPRWHFLAQLAGTNDFRDAERYELVISHTGICIFRFDSPLLFTNVDRFKSAIHKAFAEWKVDRPNALSKRDLPNVASHKELDLAHLNKIIQSKSQSQLPLPVTVTNGSAISFSQGVKGLLYRHFVIDCSGFTFVDYMGANALKEIFAEMRPKLVLVYFAAAKAPVRDLFEKSGFYSFVPKANFYPTIRDAVAIARKRRNASTLHLLDELSLPYDAIDEAISSQPMN